MDPPGHEIGHDGATLKLLGSDIGPIDSPKAVTWRRAREESLEGIEVAETRSTALDSFSDKPPCARYEAGRLQLQQAFSSLIASVPTEIMCHVFAMHVAMMTDFSSTGQALNLAYVSIFSMN